MFIIENLRFGQILSIPKLTIDQPVSCITGPSGSGKTTLLKLLNKLYLPDEGTIFLNGKDLLKMNAVALRREVVMLGQTPIIYPGTIGDNLQIGRRFSEKIPKSQGDLQNALRRVGLSKNLEDRCSTLSGGEKQRLCLARVLLMDAGVYLLDEPSSALDKETESFMVDTIAQFVKEKNKQLIMVTHSPQIAGRFESSVIRIEKGRVSEHAAHLKEAPLPKERSASDE